MGGERKKSKRQLKISYTLNARIEQNLPYFISTFTGIITGDNTYSIAFILLQFPQNGCAL